MNKVIYERTLQRLKDLIVKAFPESEGWVHIKDGFTLRVSRGTLIVEFSEYQYYLACLRDDPNAHYIKTYINVGGKPKLFGDFKSVASCIETMRCIERYVELTLGSGFPVVEEGHKQKVSFVKASVRENLSDFWIPVERKSPNIGECVLVHLKSRGFQESDYIVTKFDKYGYNISNVDAWQRLHPPKHSKGDIEE